MDQENQKQQVEMQPTQGQPMHVLQGGSQAPPMPHGQPYVEPGMQGQPIAQGQVMQQQVVVQQ